jgi:hypothetical protein
MAAGNTFNKRLRMMCLLRCSFGAGRRSRQASDQSRVGGHRLDGLAGAGWLYRHWNWTQYAVDKLINQFVLLNILTGVVQW